MTKPPTLICQALKAILLILSTSAQMSSATEAAQHAADASGKPARFDIRGDRSQQSPKLNTDSCAVRVAKACDSEGGCSYKLNLPQLDIGSLVTGNLDESNDRQLNLIAERLDQLSHTSNETRAQLAQLFVDDRLLLQNLSAKMEEVEKLFTRRFKVLEETLNFTKTSNRRVSSGATQTVDPVESREPRKIARTKEISASSVDESGTAVSEPSRNSISSSTKETVKTFPGENVTSNDSIEVIQKQVLVNLLQSQSEINNRVSNLEEALLSTIRSLERKLTGKMEAIAGACSKQTTESATKASESVQDADTITTSATAVPPASATASTEIEPEEGPRMMLCQTCCDEVPFSEYLKSIGEYSDDDETRERTRKIRHRPEYDVEEARGGGAVVSVRQDEKIATQIEEPPLNETSTEVFVENIEESITNSRRFAASVSTWHSTDPSLSTAPTNGFQTVSELTDPSADGSLTEATQPVTLPIDCADLFLRGEKRSGVYQIKQGKRGVWRVFCDMTTSGGGWTTIQKRVSGDVNFTRSWEDYRNGFGDVYGSHWLGLDRMHHLTTGNRARRVVLRIDLTDWRGVHRYAQYNLFRVKGEARRYELVARKFSGTAGDALNYGDNYNHNQQAFTTFDRDNDNYKLDNCGRYYQSGWWFNACFAANLNGRYFDGPYSGVKKGIYWGTWHRLTEPGTHLKYSFKHIDMKVRPVRYNVLRKSPRSGLLRA